MKKATLWIAAAAAAALGLLGASPASAPSFAYKPVRAEACAHPAYDAAQGTALAFGAPGETMSGGVLISPPAPKSAAAVLWVHWLGEPATTNHTEFASDARELAKHGVVSLLVDMPWSQQNWFANNRAPATDYADTIAQVVTLRRALDCLETVPGVDTMRIAYVGHDFGAMDGALLLAVDERPRYAVLVAPTLSFWEWYLLGRAPADIASYVASMSVFDLPAWLVRGKQSATLLQFGQNDEYVARATGIALRNAMPNRDRTFKSYPTDHALESEAVHEDRRAWLLAHLGA
ncbi:MAG: hypothetical protein GIW95_00925 [Candidatus Eremiobacteraeota bacterium]|nr:hypothetical protein [Candidatus Eremiobacteraeota bacterium]